MNLPRAWTLPIHAVPASLHLWREWELIEKSSHWRFSRSLLVLTPGKAKDTHVHHWC